MELNANNQMSAPVPAPEQAIQAEQAEPAAKLADVKRSWYRLNTDESATAAAHEYGLFEAIESIEGIEIAQNFEGEVPEGYELALGPLTKTGKLPDGTSGQVNIGLFAAAIPSLDAILAHEKGEDWVRRTVANKLIAAVVQSIKTASATRPHTVEDFIVSSRSTAESLAGYRKVASMYVKGLQAKNLPEMSDTLLRQILSSQAFATARYPDKKPELWEHLLDLMIRAAEKEGKPAGIMEVWKATRNTAEMAEPEDLSFDDLDAIGETETEPAA